MQHRQLLGLPSPSHADAKHVVGISEEESNPASEQTTAQSEAAPGSFEIHIDAIGASVHLIDSEVGLGHVDKFFGRVGVGKCGEVGPPL